MGIAGGRQKACSCPCGRYATDASCGKDLSKGTGFPSLLSVRRDSGRLVPHGGTPLTAAVRTDFSAIPEHSDATPQENGIALCPGLSKSAYARFFRFRLYSERGLRISRQSRSPRSSAIISTSAVAMLVATGMLYISHIRCSSLSDSLYAEGLVSRKYRSTSISLYAMREAICCSPPCSPVSRRSI